MTHLGCCPIPEFHQIVYIDIVALEYKRAMHLVGFTRRFRRSEEVCAPLSDLRSFLVTTILGYFLWLSSSYSVGDVPVHRRHQPRARRRGRVSVGEAMVSGGSYERYGGQRPTPTVSSPGLLVDLAWYLVDVTASAPGCTTYIRT